MDELAKQFGQGVRTRRRAAGLTQAALAEQVSLSEEWIRRIERGEGSPSFDTLQVLADALGASVSELFAPAPLNARSLRLRGILASMSEAELDWVDSLLKAALKYPR